MAPVLGLVLTAVLSSIIEGQAKELKIQLEHSLDGQTFKKAGYLQGNMLDADIGRGEELTLIRDDLTNQDQELLANLVQQDRIYRLRIPSDPSDSSSPKISTSIPAKCLISAGLGDYLQLHAAPNGRFIGINYDYASHPCNSEAAVTLPSELSFPESSTVAVWMPVSVPILTKAQSSFALGGKPKGSAAGGQSGTKGKPGQGEKEAPPEDTRPWIMKNWMIALPLAFVAMNLLGAVMGPQEAAAPAAGAQSPANRRR